MFVSQTEITEKVWLYSCCSATKLSKFVALPSTLRKNVEKLVSGSDCTFLLKSLILYSLQLFNIFEISTRSSKQFVWPAASLSIEWFSISSKNGLYLFIPWLLKQELQYHLLQPSHPSPILKFASATQWLWTILEHPGHISMGLCVNIGGAQWSHC